MANRSGKPRPVDALAAVGIGGLALMCCVGLPVVGGLVGGLTVAGVLGVSAAVLAACAAGGGGHRVAASSPPAGMHAALRQLPAEPNPTMKVELLYFDGCPSHEAFLPRLRDLLGRAGVGVEIDFRRVESSEAAERERFLGSPTLRIDGRDVDPGACGRDDFGLKCRLYPGREGLAGVPPDEWVLAALERSGRRGAAGGEPMSRKPDIGRLARRVVDAGPHFTSDEQGLAIRLLRLLAHGRPVPVARLADPVGLTEEEVADMLARWPGVFRNQEEAIVGFMGLTVIEMGEHRLHLADHTVSAWCAWDTLFLPELLAETVRVTSRCPVTGSAISLTVDPDGVRDQHPSKARVSFLVPESCFDGDVIQSFCHFMHFFASSEAGASWTAEHEGTFLLYVDDAFQLGRLTNRAMFRDALTTPEAA
jgi:hypothetical protein